MPYKMQIEAFLLSLSVWKFKSSRSTVNILWNTLCFKKTLMLPKLISTSISQYISGKLLTCGLSDCCTDQKGRSIFFKSLWRIMKANERWSNWITSKRIIIWCWPFSLLLVNFLFRIVCSQTYFGWMDPNYSHGSRYTMRVRKFKTKFLENFKVSVSLMSKT